MSSDFNTFIPKSDQQLVQFHLKDYPFRYVNTKKCMFGFVCWLKDLDGVYPSNCCRTAIKTTVKALALFGMMLLCPLVIGGFLLNWFYHAHQNVDGILNNLRRVENKERKQIIQALGVEKQGIIIPNVKKRPAQKNMESVFDNLNSPIFQCNGDFIAVLLQDEKTSEKRIATIENNRVASIEKILEWKFSDLISTRVSQVNASSGLPPSFDEDLKFGQNIGFLKNIMKGRGDYDKLAFSLKEQPQDKWEIGGPCITEAYISDATVDNGERKQIIDALEGLEEVKSIPVLKKRPLSKRRLEIFRQLKCPIFQSGGDYISILIQDKNTQDHKIITIKKVEDSWKFKNFPVSLASYGSIEKHGGRVVSSNTTKVSWHRQDNTRKSKFFSGESESTDCDMYIDLLEEIVGDTINKYQLA